MAEEKKMRQLIRALQAQKSDARLGAIGRVPRLGKAAEELVPLLHKLLQDRDPATRVAAARSCLYINRRDTVALAAMAWEIKKGSDGIWREDAVNRFLEGFGLHTRANAAVIAPGLTDPSECVRAAAVRALATIGKPAAEYANLAASLLRNGKQETRIQAAQALGFISDPTPEAVSALVGALGDKSSEVRDAAARSLARFGPPAGAACEALVRSLRDKNMSVRSSSAGAIAAIGCRGPEVFSALVESLSDEHGGVVNSAADALGNFGSDALPAVPALRKALETCRWPANIKMALEKIMRSGGEIK